VVELLTQHASPKQVRIYPLIRSFNVPCTCGFCVPFHGAYFVSFNCT